MQSITYLGLEIDASHAQVKVPADKVQAMIAKITAVLAHRKITLVALQSLVGSLNFPRAGFFAEPYFAFKEYCQTSL